MRTHIVFLTLVLFVVLATGCGLSSSDQFFTPLGGNTASSAPNHSPTEEEIRVTCQTRPHVTVSQVVNFPAMSNYCQWGLNGNASQLDRFFRARAEQSITIPTSTMVPQGAVLCGLDVSSANPGAAVFDDEVFFNLQTRSGYVTRNTILASSVDYSDRLDYETSASGIKYYQYDWANMFNTVYNPFLSDGNHFYCLGSPQGSECDFPPTQTYGSLFARISPEATYKLSEWIAGADEVALQEVVTGDNDNASDCQITAFSFDVTIQYATP